MASPQGESLFTWLHSLGQQALTSDSMQGIRKLAQQASTQLLSGEPLLDLFIISVSLSFASFIIALLVLLTQRRSAILDGAGILADRFRALEDLLSEFAKERAVMAHQQRGEALYIRNEFEAVRTLMADLSSQLEIMERAVMIAPSRPRSEVRQGSGVPGHKASNA